MNKSDFPSSRGKQIIISLTIALVLILVIRYSFIINSELSNKPIKLSTGEWAPFTGEDLAENGIIAAQVTKIFNEMGYDPQYEFMSWSMATEIAGLGENDSDIQGTFPYIETKERSKIFYFSDAVISLEIAFFYSTNKNPEACSIKNINDLENQVLLYIDGYESPEEISKYFDTTVVYENNIAAFQALKEREDNAIVAEVKEVGEQLLEQRFPDLTIQIQQVPFTFKVDHKLMLTKSNPNNLTVIKEFNAKLKEFKNNQYAYSSLINNVKNKINLQRAVELHPFGKSSFIYCYLDKNRNKFIVLPKGTKAVIKVWDTIFLHYHTEESFDKNSFVKIKLLNGPLSLTDSLYYIDGRSIKISNN